MGVAEKRPEESTEAVDVEVVAPDGGAAGAKLVAMLEDGEEVRGAELPRTS